jgi:hypothetical protein
VQTEGVRLVCLYVLLLSAAAHADTLGLPPCTAPVGEWKLATPPPSAPKGVVARTPTEWQSVWRAVGGKGAPPAVDFERLMVVGVTTQAKDGLVIYRIQVDDTAPPRRLEVRVTPRATFCDLQPGPPAPKVHLVATPRSALPVHVLEDGMIDGHMFGMGNEGVDSRELAAIPAATRPSGTQVLLREDAEARVRAALTPGELAELGKPPVGAKPMPRFPHLWTPLAVERVADRWRVRYDRLRFEVEVATGALLRLPEGQVIFDGTCDASGAVPISRTRFIVADDENNVLRLYDAERGGAPLATTDVSGQLHLPIKGKKRPRPAEMDLEAASRIGDRAFWLSSHGRDSEGVARPERLKLFATTIGEGELKIVGNAYDHLLDELVSAPALAPFGVAEASRIAPKLPGGLNLEGMTTTPEGHLLLGFRSPVPQGKALLIPLLNPAELVTVPNARAKFGAPIRLDLGGQGVRSLSYWRGHYLVIAGASGDGGGSRLFSWPGGDAPATLAAGDLSAINPEGFFSPEERAEIMLISDDGTVVSGGVPCKKQQDPARQRFRGLWVQPRLP